MTQIENGLFDFFQIFGWKKYHVVSCQLSQFKMRHKVHGIWYQIALSSLNRLSTFSANFTVKLSLSPSIRCLVNTFNPQRMFSKIRVVQMYLYLSSHKWSMRTCGWEIDITWLLNFYFFFFLSFYLLKLEKPIQF